MTTPLEMQERLTKNHLDIHYLVWNQNSKKPPIICIHGWMDNAMSFQPLALALPEYRIIAIELPGHGRSDHFPAGSFYHLVDYLRVVFEFLMLQSSEYVLAGHSLGGGIASLCAGYLNSYAAKIVLLEGIGPLTADENTASNQLGKYLENFHPKQDQKNDRNIKNKPTIDQLVAARARAGNLPKHLAQLLIERNLADSRPELKWKSDPRIQWPSATRMTEKQVLRILQDITPPTQFITGTKGIIKKKDYERRLGALTCEFEHSIAPGGHHLHMENPTAVAKIIRDFVK